MIWLSSLLRSRRKTRAGSSRISKTRTGEARRAERDSGLRRLDSCADERRPFAAPRRSCYSHGMLLRRRSVKGVLLITLGLSCGSRASNEELIDSSGAKKATAALGLACGLTPDFQAFLEARGYERFDFARRDLEGCSAIGGRSRPAEVVRRQPVVFVHGNSDRGVDGAFGGWNASLEFFRSSGYQSSELYAFTWGAADARLASVQEHSRENLSRVRAFLEAVLEYTGADQIDVISHSMGVTLARKAIAGGRASDVLAGGNYDLGEPLTSRIDAFVGIAGANRGLSSCLLAGSTPVCGAINGLHPNSALIQGLLSAPRAEGHRVYSIWSPGDPLCGEGAATVWGQVTARIPAQDDEIVLPAEYGHMDSKSKTAALQLELVR